jgi:hypothetical protein
VTGGPLSTLNAGSANNNCSKCSAIFTENGLSRKTCWNDFKRRNYEVSRRGKNLILIDTDLESSTLSTVSECRYTCSIELAVHIETDVCINVSNNSKMERLIYWRNPARPNRD